MDSIQLDSQQMSQIDQVKRQSSEEGPICGAQRAHWQPEDPLQIASQGRHDVWNQDTEQMNLQKSMITIGTKQEQFDDNDREMQLDSPFCAPMSPSKSCVQESADACQKESIFHMDTPIRFADPWNSKDHE